ncbi:ABC transporter substrate-binding protein [Gammaproteobacteria bacterium]|nr:ABC transporter substrate-binding protein [Gammaproteobacteria bacterium]
MNISLKTLIPAALLAASSLMQANDWTSVRIGVEGAYPPFSSVNEDGELFGFDIDIANALCEEMKAECTLVTQDWDGIIPALLAKKYDAIIASMSITEERMKKVAFTNKYYSTPAKFVQKKGADITVERGGLDGVRVGVQRATIHDDFLSGEFPNAEIVRYATQEEANLDMGSGRVDLLLADSVALDGGLLQTDAGADFEFTGPGFTDEKYFGVGAGIAIRKEDQDLVEKFNAAIVAIRANGVYESIQSKYFDFNVYGD